MGSKAKIALTPSSGEFDRIVGKEEWEQKTGLTRQKLMDAIPKYCKERSALWSFVAVFRDFFYVAVVLGFFWTVSTTHLALELPDWFPSSTIQSTWAAAASWLPEWLHQYLHVFPADWIKFHQGSANDNLFFVLNIDTMLAESWGASLLFWSMYALVQGTVFFGLWVMAHECGHGAFSSSQLLNDVVGYILHTLLLVPYFAWQFSHAKHHKYTNHLLLGESYVPETKSSWFVLMYHKMFGSVASGVLVAVISLIAGWPMYLILNTTGGRLSWKGDELKTTAGPVDHFWSSGSNLFPPAWRTRVSVSFGGILAMVAALTAWSLTWSLSTMVKWYFGPYLVVNAWLVLYTWLQHTHIDVPHLGGDAFTWLRGALCTIDRPYPMIIDHLHHRLGTTHVLHHLNHRIPHYHAQAATEAIKPVLGELYRFDPTPILTATFRMACQCDHVRGIDGIQMYRFSSFE